MTYKYIHHIPSPPLNAYIDGLFYLEGPMPLSRMKMLPMPTVQLLINFGGAISVYEPGQADPFTTCTASWWVGLWNRYHIAEWPLDAKFFVATCTPRTQSTTSFSASCRLIDFFQASGAPLMYDRNVSNQER